MDFLVPPVKRFMPDGKASAAHPISFSIFTQGTGAELAGNHLLGDFCRELGISVTRATGRSAADVLVEIRRGLLNGVEGLPAGRELRRQAYRLVYRPARQVLIQAEHAAGAFYGAVTLRQILASQVEGVAVPAGIIEDWPAFQWRGLQDDIARSRTFNMEHARREILRVARLKGNLYQLYMETRFAFPSHPDVALPGSMTPRDARELEDYAASHGVTLLPQLNTFGHLELLLAKPQYRHLRENNASRECICPLHPETRPLLRDLLNDLMDAFSSPLIPVGLDEVMMIGACPKCRKKDPGDLFLDHVKFLHKVLASRGRRMLMWHDMLLDRVQFAGSTANGHVAWAERVLEAMPRDIIICDWQYTSTADTTSHFTKKGFDALACDYVYGPIHREYPFDFSAAWHTSRHYAQAHRAGALGTILTNWGDSSKTAFDDKWLFFANSLSMSWQPAQRVMIRKMAAAWARIEMGIDGREYEDLIARMSVQIFGGTGLRSVTTEETDQGYEFFRYARSWWKAVSPELLDYERAFTGDLEARLARLRKAARRGGQYLDALAYPLFLRRLWLDEAEAVGNAARLYKKAAALPAGNRTRAALLRRAAGLCDSHAAEYDAVVEHLKQIHKMQGIAQEAFDKVRGRQAEIKRRASLLIARRLPPF
ncbi:MAG: hypothetical protein C0404_14625, partial [Verrucomicrobia bacterium]|nr:hypothetical protein [Verrucomicrobiota bacterium]